MLEYDKKNFQLLGFIFGVYLVKNSSESHKKYLMSKKDETNETVCENAGHPAN